MAMRNWIETIFGAPRRPASARPRRERDDWYIPLEVGRLEERRVLNVAPVLAGANNLNAIHQNQPAAGNTGTQVAALIAGKVTDTDPGALSGIAVTAVNNTNGTWQYSTDSGSNWTDFGSPTNSSARLLAADASTYVRFLPSADFNGAVSPGITFRAWDQTSGSAGGTADTSSNGLTTAFSALTASSNITVDQPLTITGTTTPSFNDNQTTNPFSGVTIGDSISAAENITVTLTQSSTANGALSNLGGFTDNNNGTFSFTGTAAAATTALRGLLFTPTAHQVAAGNTVDTTFTILAADSVTSTTDSSSVVHVTATNTAPTLTGANDLAAIHENDTNSSGTLVSDLIAGKASDPDFGQTLGIAITATDETHGTWQYTTDAGSNWQNVGSVANNRALLLTGDANTRVRFVPDAGFSGPVTDGITFRAWDGFTGTAGNHGNTNSNGGSTAYSSTTASSSILINDAPTLTGANDLTAINENDTTSTGTLVSALIAGKANDVNGDPLGIAVTGVDNSNGTWQYSTNGGTNWTDFGSPTAGAALLLTGNANTRVRFVPAANFFGTSSITFQAWDETSGAAGAAADVTVNGGTTAFSAGSASATIRVNAPPTISGTVAGQTTTDAGSINPFSTVVISDPDTPAQTLTVTVQIGTPANGQFTAASLTGWTTVTPGSTFSFSGTAAATTAAIRALVFQPTNHQVVPGNSVTTGFTITADDLIAPAASDAATTVVATAVNNPPTIVGTAANQPVNDNATISPFSSVTISDSDLSSEPASVTVTLDQAANGQFTTASTVGWTVNVGAGTYSFSGTRAQVQAALQALVFAPTNHQVVPGSTVTTHFTIDLTDGANSARDNTTSVIATAFNNPPTINGTQANQAVNDNATIQPFSGVTISDADLSTEPASVTVTIDRPANGQFTAASTTGWTVNVAGGVYTFGGTRAQVESALQALDFQPTNHQVNPGNVVVTHFTIGLTDGSNSASDSTTSVIATAINNPPTIVGAVANQAVNDNATIQPFSGVTIADADIVTEPAIITVTLDHAANGQFTVASTVGWIVNVGAGTYTFAGTRAAAQAALEALVFAPTNHQVVPGATVTTVFSIQLTDGLNSATDSNTSVIATAINNPPTIADATANQAVNDNATIRPFSGVSIFDPDNSAEPATITVTLDHPENGQFTAASTVGWTVNVAGGVYSFSGTRAQAQAALEALVFRPTEHQVNPGGTVTTHFTIDLIDGGNSTSDANTSVVATAINNPPTIVGTVADQTTTDDTSIALFSGVTISDPDLSTEPGSVTVTLDHAANGQFTVASTTGWAVDVAAGTYTFSGTRAQVQAALQALVFAPTNHQVVPGATVTTHFTISLDDGGNRASDMQTSVIVTAVNNPPTIVGTLANQAVNDNATIMPFSGVTISDPDNSAEPAMITVTLDHPENGQFTAASTVGWTVNVAGGIYTFSGTRAQAQAALEALVFAPTNHQVVPGSTVTTVFTIQLDDGGNLANDANTSIVATAINNPPTILGTVPNQAVGDNATISPFSGVTLSDPDNSDEPTTISVSLDQPLNGRFTAASTTGWTVDLVGGSYTFSGTRAAAQAALRALVFAPKLHQIAVGSTVTTTFTIADVDGINLTSDSRTTVIATAINDAPLLNPALGQPLTTITEDQTTNAGNTIASILGLAVSDVDFTPLQGIAITGTSVTGFGQGKWQFSIDAGGSWSDISAVSDGSALLLRSIDLVRFLPDAKNGNVATITYRAWDQTGSSFGKQGARLDTLTNGSGSPFSVATSTGALTVQNVNDAPILTPQSYFLPATVAGSTGAVNGTVVGGLPSSDVDLPVAPFAWAISSGNNGAFTINPTTGAISVANTSQFVYTGAPIVLGLTATENQFTSSAPAVGSQSLTLKPWMVTVSATQINAERFTTLTVNLLSADPAQLFRGTIKWNDGTTANVNLTPGLPLIMQHQYLTNPDAHNAAAPVPIDLTVRPANDPGAVSATASTVATVPGAGLASVKVEQATSSGFVEAAPSIILDAPTQPTSPLSSVSQTTAAGASASESINTDERLVALRLVSPSEAEAKEIILGDPKELLTLISSKRAFKMNDADLNDLPGLFKKLPDGRYQVYLAEEGHLRLVIDVIVRQGRAVDPSDDSGGRDRPPTGQIEVGHRDPIVEIKAQFQRALNGRKTDVPEAQPIDSTFAPEPPNWFVLPAESALSAAARANLPAARLDRPADGRAPSRQSAAEAIDKNHWAAPAAAAGAGVAIGAGAVLSREERIDQAMQQLDPRSLSKGARLARWLKRGR